MASSIRARELGRTACGSLKKRDNVGREIPLATENSSIVRICVPVVREMSLLMSSFTFVKNIRYVLLT